VVPLKLVYVLRPPRLVRAMTMIRNTPTAAAQIHGLEYQVVVETALLPVSLVVTSTVACCAKAWMAVRVVAKRAETQLVICFRRAIISVLLASVDAVCPTLTPKPYCNPRAILARGLQLVVNAQVRD
jgi:hypothetical protein